MNLQKIWLIAKREYTLNFKRRSYLFTAFGVPLFTIGIMVVVFALIASSSEDISKYKQIGIVDQANIMVGADGKAAVKLSDPFVMMPSQEQAAAALNNQTIDGYYVIPADYISKGQIDAYHHPALTLNDGLQDRLTALVQASLSTRIGSDNLGIRMQNPTAKLGIYKIGNPQKLEILALLAAFFLPIIFGMLIFISITTTSQFLMSGMAEEKENRMMELFVTSARPSEMLWGKILGLGALGLTQMIIWGVIGLAFASSRGTVNLGQTLADLQVTPGMLLLMLAYFVLGYLLFSTIMAAIGAMVTAEQEGRQISGMLSLIGILPIMLMISYISDPNGTIPVVFSLFPMTAPVGMILRMSWSNVPPAEIALSLALLALSVIGMIWLAARIFRLGMLSYGKRLGLREIAQAFREGRTNIVTLADAKQ